MRLFTGDIQCNPPERVPRVEKTRSTMEMFIRHLIYDVLAKKTIDNVLRLLRKVDWNDPSASRTLYERWLSILIPTVSLDICSATTGVYQTMEGQV
jgi:hypothetical protein